MSELYNRPFEVYEYSINPVRCISKSENANRIPIRISYHRKCHFNSLYDPNASPKLGLGLGLNKTFRTANCLQQELKKRESEIKKLEKNMMSDKIIETDIELSEKAMLRQAMQESIMQNRNTNKRENNKGSPKLSHKRAKIDNNNLDKPCCSKSLENVSNYDEENLTEKSSKRTNNNKSSGKSTTLPQGSIITTTADTNNTVDDDDDVIQHILELSKHEF